MGIRFFLVLLMFFCAACDSGSPKIYIFDTYYYGMPRQEVAELASATECINDLDSLCRRNPIIFFKEIWYQRFNFRRDRLISVDLINLDPKKIAPIINPWLDSGRRFVPVTVTSAGRQLDIYAIIKTQGREAARKALLDFYRSTSKDLKNIYLYLDLQDKENVLDPMNSYTAILRFAPRDIVGIQQEDSETQFMLTFFAPIAEWQDKGMPK